MVGESNNAQNFFIPAGIIPVANAKLGNLLLQHKPIKWHRNRSITEIVDAKYFNLMHISFDYFQHIVSVSELLIPMTLSLILSGIHSHIVATASSSVGGDNRNRLIQPKLKRRDPKRRRKKSMKYVIVVKYLFTSTLIMWFYVWL